MTIPREIHGQKYVSLSSYRKSGVSVATPVWFGEEEGRLYVMTRSDSGKYKRISKNPEVRLSPCTIRGKIIGPEFKATARVLPPEQWPRARRIIQSKYWLARIPFFWSKNVYLEIEFPPA